MTKKIKEFIENASPIQWIEYAEELKDASEELWKVCMDSKVHTNYPKNFSRPRLSRSYFLNIGYSIENLLKGLLISENPDYLKGGKIDDKISSKHQLNDLALKSTTLIFSDKEIKLLRILSEAIPNWSRYPIPKKWNTENKEILIDKNTRDDLLKLWDKIANKIYELTKNGWNGPEGVKFNNWQWSYFEENLIKK